MTAPFCPALFFLFFLSEAALSGGLPLAHEGDAASGEKAAVCPQGPTCPGIDVSYWQGSIDWEAVAAHGITFAFIRAADGLFEDPDFEFNWEEAWRVGILRGAYQYFRPRIDAVLQAELVLRKLPRLFPGDLPPVLDVETADGVSPEGIAAGIQTWLDTIEEATGRTPMIYTAKYFWQNSVRNGAFAQYPLWVAHWGVQCPNLPDPWTEWVFWQTSSSGHVPGISTRVDTDLFNGDKISLHAFAGGLCGDGACNGTETFRSCPQDCPPCGSIPPEGRIIDETDACFEASGTPQYWHVEEAGYGGSLLWTYAWENPEPENFGVWHLSFQQAGTYQLAAYVALQWAGSRRTVYQVLHSGTLSRVALNQAAGSGWRELGPFAFAAGGNQWVRLQDNTGEPVSEKRRIVFDALRVTPFEPPQRAVFVGDANCSNEVDIADAICVLQYLFAISDSPCLVPCCRANMDATGEGILNLADAVGLLAFLFQNGPLFAPGGTPVAGGGPACSLYPEELVAFPCSVPCEGGSNGPHGNVSSR